MILAAYCVHHVNKMNVTAVPETLESGSQHTVAGEYQNQWISPSKQSPKRLSKMLSSKTMTVKVQKVKVKRQGQVHKEGEHLV